MGGALIIPNAIARAPCAGRTPSEFNLRYDSLFRS
jgi:hypothetical protein